MLHACLHSTGQSNSHGPSGVRNKFCLLWKQLQSRMADTGKEFGIIIQFTRDSALPHVCQYVWICAPSSFILKSLTLLRFSAHFLIGLFVFLILSCMSCLYILEINPLSVASFVFLQRTPTDGQKTHMKRYSTLLITREKQIKTTMRYHPTPARLTIIKKSANSKC